MNMNVQFESPGVVGPVAKRLDPRAAAGDIAEAAAPKIPRSLARWRLVRALEWFETNFDRPIRLDDVADAVRMSTSHFSRAFRNSVGESPARYLRRYRVRRAHEMMLSTRKSLSEIALNCGFADQSHFTRTFSRIVGVSPAAWRRSFSSGSG